VSPLELLASALGAIAVVLTIRQNPWCWPIGLVMVLLYAWIFFEVKLYANVALQFVFAGSQLYGWWLWTRGGEQPGQPLGSLSWSQRLTGLLLAALAGLLLGYALQHGSDAAAPWQDAGLTAFSLLAQLWMALKRVECWPLWIVVDVLYVALFISSAMYLTAGLYGLFTLLAVHGWLSWHRELERSLAKA